MHTVSIHNKSGHEQTFEVHGWNNNNNISVKANSTYVLNVDDSTQTSAAIIAVHDGHEGEQAEMTKNGFQHNDWIDISNIVGAGGNMTIMQEGDFSTLKGDGLFMQDLNKQWHKSDAQIKAALKDCVHLDGNDNVVRIDAIKDHPKLEEFVRRFADGKTYIGVGAWAGSPGHGTDNAQSSAAHGTKNLLITYSDGDARPSATANRSSSHAAALPTSTAFSTAAMKASAGSESTSVATQSLFVAKAVPHVDLTQQAARGPGIILTNKTAHEEEYFFYPNFWNGNGTAGANFDKPSKSAKLNSHQTAFVSLPADFKGRLQRGKLQPATWVEFQLDASNDHKAHGDISLQQGYDGPAIIKSSDGKRANGFENEILKDAPPAAKQKRADGETVLASTMGNWMGGPNQAAIDYERKVVGQKKAYITGGTGTDDVGSDNQCLIVDMY